MTNKPKQIGTRAESAVLKVLKLYWPNAKRLVLAGSQDRGDIGDTGDFIFEVKGGVQADRPGDAALAGWMRETNLEAHHSGVHVGVLVTQRKGVGIDNADRWYAWLTLHDLTLIAGDEYIAANSSEVVRLELRHFLEFAADNGWVADAP
jgi:hypothetical protein